VALRDRSYMQVAVLSGLLIMSRSLMTIAMPLWVATHTSVPRSVVAALLVGNTILSIVLQVPASKRADTAESARRTARRGGLLILPAGAMFAAATAVPVPAAILLLAVGVAGLAAAELFASVAAWSLSFELADSRVPGQYQGAFSLGLAVETVVGPLLATGVVLGLGASGWLLAGLLLGVVGIGLAATVRRVLAAQTGAAEPTVRLPMDVTLRLAYPEAATDLLSIPATTTRAPERPPAVDVPMLLPVYAVGRATPVRSSNRQFAFVRTSTQTAVH
jgi:MFS family permease